MPKGGRSTSFDPSFLSPMPEQPEKETIAPPMSCGTSKMNDSFLNFEPIEWKTTAASSSSNKNSRRGEFLSKSAHGRQNKTDALRSGASRRASTSHDRRDEISVDDSTIMSYHIDEWASDDEDEGQKKNSKQKVAVETTKKKKGEKTHNKADSSSTRLPAGGDAALVKNKWSTSKDRRAAKRKQRLSKRNF
jgi:hypothetical protein